MTLEVVLKTIAVIVVIKAILISIAPSFFIKLVKKLAKDKKTMRKLALIYLIAAIIVYLITYYI